LRKYGYIRGDASETTPKTVAQQARHEQFKKRLLLDDRALLPNPPTFGVRGIGADDNTLDPLDATHESESEADQESDDQFKELQERFANRGRKGKQPAASPKKRTKKVVEVGPSGQAYTPLELQVGSDLSPESRSSNGNYLISRFVSSRRITLERCSWLKLATSSSFSAMTQR
jgi:DNA mismatch repair protein MSH3